MLYSLGLREGTMTERHIIFTAEITPDSATNFINVLVAHGQGGTTRLVIAMNCPGGTVVAGVAIYNALMAMPMPIVTHNIGNVDSIGNIIFIAGGERYACPATTFMFHGVAFGGNANERLEEKTLAEKLDTARADHKRLAEIISGRSALSERSVRNLFKQQRTRSVGWAQRSGIINDVRPYVLGAPQNVSLFTK
jgi:ATP-dependent Clp protease protease subunit